VISFENQPLKSLNNGAFGQLFAGATLMDQVSIGLKGAADVTARTSIGDVPIAGIGIDVTTSLKGINAFGHTAQLSNVSVAGSGGQNGNEFIVSPLTTMLQNPSNISLNTVDVALPVMFQGTMLGRAAINVSALFTSFIGDKMIDAIMNRNSTWLRERIVLRLNSTMNPTTRTTQLHKVSLHSSFKQGTHYQSQ
jgi:hypothetical protein